MCRDFLLNDTMRKLELVQSIVATVYILIRSLGIMSQVTQRQGTAPVPSRRMSVDEGLAHTLNNTCRVR